MKFDKPIELGDKRILSRTNRLPPNTITGPSHIGWQSLADGLLYRSTGRNCISAGNGFWTGASAWGKRDSCPHFWLGLAGASGIMIAALGFVALLAFAR
jgi:hypothetical protein